MMNDIFGMNTLVALMEYFGVDEKEFIVFWRDLSPVERKYYRFVSLN